MDQMQVVGFVGVFVVTALAGGAVGVLALAFSVNALALAAGAVLAVIAGVTLLVVVAGRLGAPMPSQTTYW